MNASPDPSAFNGAGNGDVAVAFLELLRPGGPWLLNSFDPEDGQARNDTVYARDPSQVRAFVAKHDGKQNIYFSTNPTRGPMGKKAAKTDIAAIEYALADCDPEKDETPEHAQQRYLAAVRTAGVPEPTFIISSGNGIQFLWRFEEPIDLTAFGEPVRKDKKVRSSGGVEATVNYLALPGAAQAVVDDVEARVEAMMLRLGTKAGTQNIDRILRLPGTMNLPGKAKKKIGRTERRSSLVAHSGAAHALAAFPKEARADEKTNGDKRESPKDHLKSVDDLRVSKRIKAIISTGDDPDATQQDRSANVMAVCVAFAANDYGHEVFERFLLDPAYPISEHVLEQMKAEERYLPRQIEQAREWVKSHNPKVDLFENYGLVIVGSKCAVLNVTEPKLTLMTIDAFRQWNADQFVKDEDGKRASAVKRWMTSGKKKKFSGIVFAPGQEPNGKWNLFTGFPIKPGVGSWARFKEHLLNNVARGNVDHFEWIVGFFAQIIQQPGKKLDVAIGMRGEEGVGKTKVGDVFGHLLGRYYMLVDSPRMVVGQFNAHLACLLLLHADEAFWSGDHTARGKINNLISGNKIQIEQKGLDTFEVDNNLRIIVTGNPDWIVPAGLGARRWAVFNVSSDHKEDHAYFAAIDAEMETGGYRALMRDLLEFDLSRVNLREVPKTLELFHQQVAGLDLKEGWLLDFLTKGEMPCGAVYGIGHCPTAALFTNYVEATKTTGSRYRGIQTSFGIFLKEFFPTLFVKPVMPSGSKKQTRCYQFPSLKQCRAAFDKKVGQPVEWPELDAEWQHYDAGDDDGGKPF